MKKLVNGVAVDMSQDEAADAQAQWDAYTAAQPARAVESARQAAIDAAIAGDTTVRDLRAMSAAEFDAWWTANVTTLAQANNVLKRVTRVVLRRVL